jgi:hypothetical protein
MVGGQKDQIIVAVAVFAVLAAGALVALVQLPAARIVRPFQRRRGIFQPDFLFDSGFNQRSESSSSLSSPAAIARRTSLDMLF